MNNQQITNLIAWYGEGRDFAGEALEAFYIEWFNNYLTTEKYAEHLGNAYIEGVSLELVEKAISLGRTFNHQMRGLEQWNL